MVGRFGGNGGDRVVGIWESGRVGQTVKGDQAPKTVSSVRYSLITHHPLMSHGKSICGANYVLVNRRRLPTFSARPPTSVALNYPLLDKQLKRGSLSPKPSNRLSFPTLPLTTSVNRQNEYVTDLNRGYVRLLTFDSRS